MTDSVKEQLEGKSLYGKDAFDMLWEALPQYGLAAEHNTSDMSRKLQPIYDMSADEDVESVYYKLGDVSDYMRDVAYYAKLVADLSDDLCKLMEKEVFGKY